MLRTWIPSVAVSSLISDTIRFVFSSSRAASIYSVILKHRLCFVEDVYAEWIATDLGKNQRDGQERLLSAG